MGIRPLRIARFTGISLCATGMSVAPRLRWPCVPRPVGVGRWMGKVGGHIVVNSQRPAAAKLFEYRREPRLILRHQLKTVGQ